MREEVPLTGTRAGATVETFESFFERVLPRALGVATGLLGDRTAAEDAATEAQAPEVSVEAGATEAATATEAAEGEAP